MLMLATARIHQYGIAFTELLITLLLSVILIGGVVSVFTGGLRSSDTTVAAEQLVMGGRTALEQLRVDLRQAGFTGCNSVLAMAEAGGQSRLQVLTRSYTAGAPATASTPLRAYAGGVLADLDWIADDDLVSAPHPDSNVLAVSYGAGPGVRVATHRGIGAHDAAELELAAESDFNTGDQLLVANCAGAALFRAQRVSGTPPRRIAITPDAGNVTADLGRDYSQADVYRWQRALWYVASNPRGGRSLFRNQALIADGVEQMILEFGVDSSGNRRVDTYIGQEDVRDWDRVLAVRVHLLLATASTTAPVALPQSLEFAGVPFIAPDQRLYQSFTTTVGLRNRLP